MDTKAHFIGIEEVPMAAIARALQQQGRSVTTSTTNPTTPPNRSTESTRASDNDDKHAAVVIGRNVDQQHAAVSRCQQEDIPFYSYPAYLQALSKDKQRILVLGNEEIVTPFFSILLHVMRYWKLSFDYVTLLPDTAITPTVQLSDAPLIFLQGDITTFSALDPRSVASIYQPHVVVLMDLPHSNHQESTDTHIAALQYIADAIPKAGKLIYNKEIVELCKIGTKDRTDVESVPFQAPAYKTDNLTGVITTSQGEKLPLALTAPKSLEALACVGAVLRGCAIPHAQCYEAIQAYE